MNEVFGLLIVALTSWQVKTIFGLILLDVVLGVASALKRGVFDWAMVAMFYRTNVIPYLLGYAVLYVVISFVIPPDALGGNGDVIGEGTVIAAWGFVLAALLGSIRKSLQELYQPAPNR